MRRSGSGRASGDSDKALVYVFRNLAHHGTRLIGDGAVDPLSSATRFTGWAEPIRWPFDDGPWPDAPPRTWLLGIGWSSHGGGPTTQTKRKAPSSLRSARS